MDFSERSRAILFKAGSAALAAHRGFSVRTLRRRLEVDGDTLRGCTDRLRAADAIRFLSGGRSPTEVARLLGFATPQSFCRFCYRVWGEAPTALQRRLRAGTTIEPRPPELRARPDV
jgi:AraC-like DNA-binding protein